MVASLRDHLSMGVIETNVFYVHVCLKLAKKYYKALIFPSFQKMGVQHELKQQAECASYPVTTTTKSMMFHMFLR